MKGLATKTIGELIIMVIVVIILGAASVAALPYIKNLLAQYFGLTVDDSFTEAVECSYLRCSVGCSQIQDSGPGSRWKNLPGQVCCQDVPSDFRSSDGKVCDINAIQYPVQVKNYPGGSNYNKNSFAGIPVDCVFSSSSSISENSKHFLYIDQSIFNPTQTETDCFAGAFGSAYANIEGASQFNVNPANLYTYTEYQYFQLKLNPNAYKTFVLTSPSYAILNGAGEHVSVTISPISTPDLIFSLFGATGNAPNYRLHINDINKDFVFTSDSSNFKMKLVGDTNFQMIPINQGQTKLLQIGPYLFQIDLTNVNTGLSLSLNLHTGLSLNLQLPQPTTFTATEWNVDIKYLGVNCTSDQPCQTIFTNLAVSSTFGLGISPSTSGDFVTTFGSPVTNTPITIHDYCHSGDTWTITTDGSGHFSASGADLSCGGTITFTSDINTNNYLSSALAYEDHCRLDPVCHHTFETIFSPTTLSLTTGSTKSTTIDMIQNGCPIWPSSCTTSVSVSATNVPLELTVTFDKQSGTTDSGTNFVSTMTVSSSTPGTYTFTVNAQHGSTTSQVYTVKVVSSGCPPSHPNC